MKAKLKKCRACKKEFKPRSTTQVACSIGCALTLEKKKQALAVKKEQAETRKAIRQQREKLKSKAQWMREAQSAFNAYIRERDKGESCISCGRHHDGQYHAGHYKTTAAAPELRFHPFNNNKQCAPCNNHLSGNIVNYRPRLISKIGLKNVEWLEGPQQLQKLTIEDIKEIKQYYKEQLKVLKSMTPFDKFVEGFND